MKNLRICYFGIYNPLFSRNQIYMAGLREQGATVIECNDRSSGCIKFWRLYKKHAVLGNTYDAMIVGYPSQIAVPLARLISSKKVIFDSLCSLYEGEIISRGVSPWSPKAWKTWLVDFLAYQFADHIILETNAQIDFVARKFFVSKKKCSRVFTGALDSIFFPDPSVQKKDVFTAVFRGQFLPEAGVPIILEVAKILEHSDVNFLFIGRGFLEKETKEKIRALGLHNVSLLDTFIAPDILRKEMLSCHVSLGQFDDHPRLARTIPHKAFEALALGLPYVTGRAEGVSELLTDKENCLMSELGNAEDLAEKILQLKNNQVLVSTLGNAGHVLYRQKLTPKILAGEILNIF